MTTQDLTSLTLSQASDLVKSRQVSPVDLVQACLDRIDRLDGKLNSFLTLCPDQALAAARRAEEEIAGGNHRGDFHGVPYAVKDIYNTAGIRTTNGSKVFKDYVPDNDCTAVVNLNTAGGVLVGKNSCLEFACGNHHEIHGEVHNPWNLDHSPGGSSSGSGASVAASLIFGSMGSCTGGSIRGPASNCSIVGHKPTYGLVSRHGVFPLSWSLDHAGPMTRTVEDCAIMLQAVAGYDPKDPSSAHGPDVDYRSALTGDIRGLRIGVPVELNEGCDDSIASLIQDAIAVLMDLGAEIQEVSLPIAGAHATFAGSVITWSEEAQVHAPWFDRIQDYTEGARQKVLSGAVITGMQYHKAQQIRRLVIDEMNAVLQNVDLLVGPVAGSPPGRLPTGPGAGTKAAASVASERSFSRPYNMTGTPSVSVPCGFTPEGLPIGLQISGRLLDDSTVLKAAHAYEQATPWHKMHPNL